MDSSSITANQYPHLRNRFTRLLRAIFSFSPQLRFTSLPARLEGISVVMRVKNEADWIKPSIESIKGIADEIIVVDNGSTDGTYEILEEMTSDEKGLIKLWRKPDLNHCDLSNFALEQTSFRWVFRWDADMVAHTTGDYNISHLRERLLSLDDRRYYLIYLRHINLSGDLFHQDPKEMVHIEEYIHSFSEKARYIHPGRFEAIKVPKYYRVLFWYEPYSFHVNVKPARRLLLRYFWEDWMELKDYKRYQKLEDYVKEKIKDEFKTDSCVEAERPCVKRVCSSFMRYDPRIFGPYPDLLKPYLEMPKYRLIYKDGKIVGRDEN
jgi:glycosyltransferase involved in cell wall biosynthesis